MEFVPVWSLTVLSCQLIVALTDKLPEIYRVHSYEEQSPHATANFPTVYYFSHGTGLNRSLSSQSDRLFTLFRSEYRANPLRISLDH